MPYFVTHHGAAPPTIRRFSGPGATVWVLAVLITVLPGCATPPPATADNPLEIDTREYGRVMDAAVAVLRDAGFEIDEHDYRFGRVTTRPLASPLLLEFWKQTTPGPDARVQSTVNDDRRSVTVTLAPIAEGAGGQPPAAYDLSVQVLIERRQHAGKHLTGSTKTLWAAPAVQPVEWRRRGIEARYWQPIGRDAAFEKHLLAEIIRRSLDVQSQP